jgi:glutaredoxin-like protein DUF836
MKNDDRPKLTLLGRDGCHLCDEMQAALQPLSAKHGFKLEVLEVDAEAGFKREYGGEIPVLLAGNVEICRHRLDAGRLEAWLKTALIPAPQGQIG